MTEIVTIAERKARAAPRLAAAVDAVMAVEEACRTHGIRPDIHSTATAAPSFVARVSAEAVVLG